MFVFFLLFFLIFLILVWWGPGKIMNEDGGGVRYDFTSDAISAVGFQHD